VVSVEAELLTIENGVITHPHRGGVTLMHRLQRIYDAPNVIGIDVLLGERELKDVRKLDKSLEQRLQSMLKGTQRGSGPGQMYTVLVRLTAVIG
jgi:hypothetical protein